MRFEYTNERIGQQHCLDVVRKWLSLPELHALTKAFGIPWPSGDMLDTLPALADASKVWDFRQGKERTDIVAQNLESVSTLVSEAAFKLGLANDTQPTQKQYSHIVVLGGTILSCMLRVNHALALIEGSVECKNVDFLGTRRVPSPLEIEGVRNLGLELPDNVENEFEVLLSLAKARGADTVDMIPSELGETIRLQSKRGVEIRVLQTLGTRGRATTADTYHHLASMLPKGGDLLICTTQIYVPFQFFDAIRSLALPAQSSLEIIGHPRLEGMPLHRTENYLQEIRSAILSAQRLVAHLTESTV